MRSRTNEQNGKRELLTTLLTAKRGEIEIAQRFQNGGGGRTRTCEAMRRLIYSQLPLPLGTLPPLDGSPIRPLDEPATDLPWA